MTATPQPEPAAGPERPAERKGEPPGGGSSLNDDIAQEVQTGISSPDADEHAGSQAPASEGQPPG